MAFRGGESSLLLDRLSSGATAMMSLRSSLPLPPATCKGLSSRFAHGDVSCLKFQLPVGERSRRLSFLLVQNVGWDPEGILAPPKVGHIARRQMQKTIVEDEEEKQRKEQRRRAAREARVIPEAEGGLVAYFLETDKEEIEFEIARLRPRLDSFLRYLKAEVGSLRFAITQTESTKERMAELEALEKKLSEAVEKHDSLTGDFMGAKDRLTKLLVSKDKKTTLLDMVGNNEIDRPLLALLDQNIVAAKGAGQDKVVEFMEKLRSSVVKYITV